MLGISEIIHGKERLGSQEASSALGSEAVFMHRLRGYMIVWRACQCPGPSLLLLIIFFKQKGILTLPLNKNKQQKPICLVTLS